MKLAEEIVLYQIGHGGDFLATIAKKFLENHAFYEFSNSQLNNLRKEIEKTSNFSDMREKVNGWIVKLAEREKGKNWLKVRESLPKTLFEWDSYADQIKNVALHGLKKEGVFSKNDKRDIDYLITKDNIRKNLDNAKFLLAKRMFSIIMTLHKCYNTKEIKSDVIRIDFNRANKSEQAKTQKGVGNEDF